MGVPSFISLAGVVIVCDDGGGGFQGGIPNVEEVEGKGMVMGDAGTMGVSSEGEVPVETKAGAAVQTRLSYIGSLQDPGISMLMGSGVWSRGSLMESGVSDSGRRMSSSIGDGVCHSVSESMVA